MLRHLLLLAILASCLTSYGATGDLGNTADHGTPGDWLVWLKLTSLERTEQAAEQLAPPLGLRSRGMVAAVDAFTKGKLASDRPIVLGFATNETEPHPFALLPSADPLGLIHQLGAHQDDGQWLVRLMGKAYELSPLNQCVWARPLGSSLEQPDLASIDLSDPPPASRAATLTLTRTCLEECPSQAKQWLRRLRPWTGLRPLRFYDRDPAARLRLPRLADKYCDQIAIHLDLENEAIELAIEFPFKAERIEALGTSHSNKHSTPALPQSDRMHTSISWQAPLSRPIAEAIVASMGTFPETLEARQYDPHAWKRLARSLVTLFMGVESCHVQLLYPIDGAPVSGVEIVRFQTIDPQFEEHAQRAAERYHVLAERSQIDPKLPIRSTSTTFEREGNSPLSGYQHELDFLAAMGPEIEGMRKLMEGFFGAEGVLRYYSLKLTERQWLHTNQARDEITALLPKLEQTDREPTADKSSASTNPTPNTPTLDILSGQFYPSRYVRAADLIDQHVNGETLGHKRRPAMPTCPPIEYRLMREAGGLRLRVAVPLATYQAAAAYAQSEPVTVQPQKAGRGNNQVQ